MEFIFALLAFACGAYFVAKSNERNPYLWAGLGLVIGPFAILIVALLGPANPEEDSTEKDDN